MNDPRTIGLKERELKIVGTRPLRPDGVDKVTGRAKFGADLHVREHADRQGAAQPARACAHQVDRHFQGAGAARGEGGDHLGRLFRSALGVHSRPAR